MVLTNSAPPCLTTKRCASINFLIFSFFNFPLSGLRYFVIPLFRYYDNNRPLSTFPLDLGRSILGEHFNFSARRLATLDTSRTFSRPFRGELERGLYLTIPAACAPTAVASAVRMVMTMSITLLIIFFFASFITV